MLQAFLQRCTLSLRKSIKGIIFFGTPNYELDDAQGWVDFAAATSNIAPSLGYKPRAFTSNDGYLSELGLINNEFKNWLPGEAFARMVLCLYEQSPTVQNGIVR